MIHLGLQSIDLLKLRSAIRHEGVWMFLGVSGPWLSAWLSIEAAYWEIQSLVSDADVAMLVAA